MELICGNKFKELANDKIVYRTVDELFSKTQMPNIPFILISHAGDTCVSEHLWVIDNPNLIHWYATNSDINDSRVTCIPIGIEYRLLKEHEKIFQEVMAMDIPKSEDVSTDCFALHTWVEERNRCKVAMDRNGLVMDERKPYHEYLMSLKQSRFCPCPIGNGKDTFRFWECLYLKCVPIIVQKINKEHNHIRNNFLFADIINSWEEFNKEKYNQEYYSSFNLNYDELDFNYWKTKILNT